MFPDTAPLSDAADAVWCDSVGNFQYSRGSRRLKVAVYMNAVVTIQVIKSQLPREGGFSSNALYIASKCSGDLASVNRVWECAFSLQGEESQVEEWCVSVFASYTHSFLFRNPYSSVCSVC